MSREAIRLWVNKFGPATARFPGWLRLPLLRRFALAALGSTVLAWSAVADEAAAPEARACAKAGTWLNPGTGEAIAPGLLMASLARRSVVLLGEEHDNAEHHRWQLQMLAALHAHQPDLIVGFEMFPRRVQPALDRWAAGELDVQTFLKQSEWGEVWSFDPDLYLPLFHFARQNRLSMVALNVERTLVARVGREGWAAIPIDQRVGLSDPAAASDAYLSYLAEVFVEKQYRRATDEPQEAEAHPNDAADPAPVVETDEFKRFTAAQLTWDRAMAEALAAARWKRPESLVVGVVGRGHAQFGHGVPHQLADLGVADTAVVFPVDMAAACKGLPGGIADAVFVVAPPERIAEAPSKPKLGVMIQRTDDGVRIMQVVEASIAETSALAAGDILVSAAGRPIEDVAQLIAIIGRQAPGTWLPLTIRRQGRDLEVVAKFPTEFAEPK